MRACVHSCMHCVCVCLFLYRYLMYVFILVSYFVCLSVFVCVTDARQSSDQPGTSSRQRGQSHSLIILTFLHNDPMHNSPFSAFFSLPPSICLTHAFHFTPIHSLYIYIYFFLGFIYLITSFFLPPYNYFVHL